MGGPHIRGRGPTSKGTEGRREGREFPPPKVKVSRINTESSRGE